MKGYTLFWELLLIFSIASFTILSIVIIFKGFEEIKDVFKQLAKKIKKQEN